MRMHSLKSLEEMVTDFYIPFFKQVEQPYSPGELEILVRIVKLMSSQIRGDFFGSCPNENCACYLNVFSGPKSYFRLTLPSVNPFTIQARTRFLKELESLLHCFFVHRGKRPYSEQEQKILKRVKKGFIHQLAKTPKYDLFKGKRVHHVTEEEQLELDRQRKDEARLNHVSLYHYNPRSEKYKKIKEEFLKEFRQKFGDD